MSFTQYQPAGPLREYIDAYWVRVTPLGLSTAVANLPVSRRIYADGCSDIFVNMGAFAACYNSTVSIHPGRLYLGGTMTAYGVVSSMAGSVFVGIRFRPGGFFALYRIAMEEALDLVIEFPDPELLSLLGNHAAQEFAAQLDGHFLTKPVNLKHDFVSIYQKIYHLKGQVSVEGLSRDSHVSHRTMDRIFKQNVGTHPKEFIQIVRFQEVLKRLRSAASGQTPPESLLRIAYELGYYDHAHLTNEFKRYSGVTPSEWEKEQ